MYASVNRVYETLRRIYNKQQHGFLSYADFNRFADNGQKDVFNDMLAEYKLMLNNKRRYLSNWKGAYTSVESLETDLRTLRRSRVPLSSLSNNNIFEYPDDFAYILNLSFGTESVDVISHEESDFVLNSSLASPSTVNPVALSNFNSVEIFPDTIQSNVLLSYYKIPRGSDSSGNPSTQSPTISTINVSGKEVYNPSTSINFELPETVEVKIVVKILQYLGINMREPEVEAYSQREELKEDQENL